MLKILGMLRSKDEDVSDLQTNPSPSAELAFLSEGPVMTTPSPLRDGEGIETVAKIGEENETLRLLFLEAQRRIDDLDALRASFAQLTVPLDRSLRLFTQERIENNTLRSNLSDARGRMDLMRHELVRLQKRIEVFETENASLTKDIGTTKEILELTENTRIELSQELNQARSQITELEQKIVRSDEYEQALVNDNKALRDMIVAKDTQINQLEANSVRLSERVALLEGDATSLSEALALKQEEHTRATRRLSELEHDLDRTRVNLSQTKTLLNEVRSERKAISDQFDDLNNRHQAEKSALGMKVEGLQSRVTLGERLLTEARNSVIEKSEELRAAERKLVDSSVAAAASDQKITQLKLTIENLERQIRELEQSRSSLVDRTSALTKNLKARDSALAKLDDRIPILMGRIDHLEAQIEASRVNYQTRIDELSVALETERMERAVAEGALGIARKDRGILQRELIKTEGAAKALSEPTGAVLDISGQLIQQPVAAKTEATSG